MRKWLMGSVVAIIIALGLSSGILAQNTASQGGANAPAPDLTGVWRRSRRPPDNARRYTMHEIAGTLTNQEPPMTPWAEATGLGVSGGPPPGHGDLVPVDAKRRARKKRAPQVT